MRNVLTTFIFAAVLVAFIGTSHAAIGWAGQIWPVHDHTVTEGGDVDVYVQIWKDGYTSNPGRGDSISATLYYGPNGGPYSSVAMSYNTDKGNNDEYVGYIPSTAIEGQAEIWFYCDVYDSTDASTYTGAQDQNSNDPPFKLNITPALNQNVMVYFIMCMPPEGHDLYDPDPGDVCITGDHAEITNWGSGVQMYRPCEEYSPQFYEVGVQFLAGGNPIVQYKYRHHDCVDWEAGGNHQVTIDDTQSTFIIPWVDHFSYYEGDDCPICGVGAESTTWGNIKQMYK
jgi:hypothetical protein